MATEDEPALALGAPFEIHPSSQSRLLAALRLLRPAQWIKNGFLLAPLFFTPNAVTHANLLAVALAFTAFSCLASAVYIINDYADRANDRLHPEKRYRPLAAGTLPLPIAFIMLAMLLAIGTVIALDLGRNFAGIALLYLATNLFYSFWLKRISIIDVMLIAFGYVLRVYAGAAAVGLHASVWIVICTGLVSLFIALAKRRDDLVRNLGGGGVGHRAALAGYTKPFLDTSIGVVLGGLLVSYLIYITASSEVSRLVGGDRLVYTAPFVVMGILRYLQIVLVEEKSGSPTKLVLTDRFLIYCLGGWVMVFGVILYG